MNEEFSIPAIRERLEHEYKGKIKALSEHGCKYGEVLRALPNGTVISADQITEDWFTITISGDKHDFAAAVRAMRTRGFSSSSTMPGKSDSSWSGFFNHDSGAAIYLSFSSKVCRRVKIGTKTVEQDIYETVCDETILPERNAVPA